LIVTVFNIPSEFATIFGARKLGLADGEKSVMIIFSGFDTVYECNSLINGWTEIHRLATVALYAIVIHNTFCETNVSFVIEVLSKIN